MSSTDSDIAEQQSQPSTQIDDLSLQIFSHAVNLNTSTQNPTQQQSIYALQQNLVGRRYAVPQQPRVHHRRSVSSGVIPTSNITTVSHTAPQQQQQQQQVPRPTRMAQNIAVKLPEPKRFNGSTQQVENWIYGLELYFQACGLDASGADGSKCAAIAATLLEGSAQQWHRRLSILGTLPQTYTLLKTELKTQFGFMDEERRARDKLKEMRQTKTVIQYVRDFENVTLHLPSATDDELKHSFVYGLKSAIRSQVLMSNPKDLNDAMTKALACEDVRYTPSTQYTNNSRPNMGYAPMEIGNVKKWKGKGKQSSKKFNNTKRGTFDINKVRCHACNQYGHFQKDCPNKNKRLSHMETQPKNDQPSTSQQ